MNVACIVILAYDPENDKEGDDQEIMDEKDDSNKKWTGWTWRLRKNSSDNKEEELKKVDSICNITIYKCVIFKMYFYWLIL